MTIEPERRSMASCCSATPEKIDLTWLQNNPGQLFNTPSLKNERQQMLDNQPVASCNSCWQAEQNNLPSRRTTMKSCDRTHIDTVSIPRFLHINLSSDCNLTCSYCCKQYSTAWLRDIATNGGYLDEERYALNNNDRMLLKLGQRAIKSSPGYQSIVNEIKNMRSAKKIEITGGEPFLYNGLEDLVAGLTGPVDIFTGLGVNSVRLEKMLDLLPPHVTFTVSAENIGPLYELNRYGNTWSNFLTNLDLISRKFSYRFCTVISNLTIHGLAEFRKQFGTDRDLVNFCSDPDYLSASVLDPTSKDLHRHMVDLADVLSVEPKAEQRAKLKTYLNQFVARRNIDISVLPKHFVSWVND